MSAAARQLDVGRLTLIELGASNDCSITYVDRDQPNPGHETFMRASIPAIAAHVITTKRPAWHMREETDKYRQIRRNEPKRGKFRSQTFSVVPMTDSTQVAAVLAMTNYGDNARDIEIRQDLREGTFDILQPYFVEATKKRRSHRLLAHSERTDDASRAFARLAESARGDGLEHPGRVLQEALDVVLRVVGTSGYIAEVDPSTYKLRLHAVSGFNEKLRNQLLKGSIFASPDNQQGPLPLAFNRDEIILVSDIRQIEHVLHPVSLKILQENGTGSVAAVPLHLVTTDELGPSAQSDRRTWGLLWIELARPQELTLAYIGLLEMLQREVNGLIRLLNDGLRMRSARRAMSEMMPAWAAEKLIAGGSPVEQDIGYMLVIDLKGSSKIAQAIGSGKWSEFIKEEAVPRFLALAKERGFYLHQVIWDAFYLCKSALTADGATFDGAVILAAELIAESDLLYLARDFISVPGVDRTAHAARACVTFGDTTRGLTSSPSPTWSVTGTAMAIVSKLEAQVKGCDGDIFVLSRDIPKARFHLWRATGRIVDAANDEAFSIDATVQSEYLGKRRAQ